MRWFVREIVPLIIILLIVAIFTLVPYYNTRNRLSADERTNLYLCKLSLILRTFANTAADARLISARVGDPELKKANFHAARVYIKVRNNLKALPPHSDCDKLLQGAKNGR